MPIRLNRRLLTVGLLATAGAPALASAPDRVPANDVERLPDHAALWARLPLPFTPAQAWISLPRDARVEIGAAVIGMALAEYIHGDQFAEADQFLDVTLRETAYETADDLLQRITPRLWELFPDLFGFEGEHPAWALRAGMVR